MEKRRYKTGFLWKDWKHKLKNISDKGKEWFRLVKGTSRRVIVVDSPDPKLFEQAIFIVKNEAFTEGVTSQQVLGEACRIAQGYAAGQERPFWKRIPLWGLVLSAAALAGIAAGLLLWLL